MHDIIEQAQRDGYLRQHQLEDMIKAPLRESTTLHQFEKGERICAQGDRMNHLYILVEGRIKIFTSSPQGRTLILCFKQPIEAIGDIEYIQKKAVINTVEAVSRVRMLKIPYRAMDMYGADSVPLLQFLLRVITEKFYDDSNFASFNLLHPVETRLASYLLSASLSESKQNSEQLRFVKMADLANLLGTSYRHLNRVIEKMNKEQLIFREKGAITILNRQGLKAIAEPTSSVALKE